MSLSGVYYLMKKRMRLSFKKVHPIEYSGKIKDLIPTKMFVSSKIIEALISGKVLISFDEAQFNRSIHPNYGWSGIGERTYKSAVNLGTSYSVLASITINSPLTIQIVQGNVDQYCVIHFLIETLRILKSKGYELQKEVVFLLDNASYHRSKEVMQFFKRTGIHVIFNAPYCFNLNPIERIFGIMKNRMRNNLATLRKDNYKDAIVREFCNLRYEDCLYGLFSMFADMKKTILEWG